MQASKRTFGVEVECGHPTLNYLNVSTRLRAEGIPIQSATMDGSGIEIRSAVYSGEKGYADLTRLMEYLNELGCYVARRDGMHVHIGAKELQTDRIAGRTLARTWYNNQELIGRMCSNHRTGSSVCPRVNYDDLPHLETGYYRGSRKALNTRPIMAANARVEFRLHEGCLDPRKAVAWIQFCQSLVQYAVDKKEILTCASKTALLSAIGTPEDAISVLSPRQKQLRRVGKTYVKKGAKK